MTDQRVAAYEDAEMEELITYRKLVIEAPKRDLKLVGAYWRNDMKLLSEEGSRNFSVFMRRNADLPENFSIGLIYNPNDARGEITLLRCNGPHGLFNGNFNFDPGNPHWEYHVHRATAGALDAGLRPDKHATKTNEYASYQEALEYFLTTVNVSSVDILRCFPDVRQGRFWQQ